MLRSSLGNRHACSLLRQEKGSSREGAISMGNCQAAADAAAAVIQHPGGKAERLHCPTSAAEVMRSNPGHRVALVTLCAPSEERQDGGRVTRVRLLGPKDVLLLGQVYRLVTSQGSSSCILFLFFKKKIQNFLFLVRNRKGSRETEEEPS